MYDTGSADASRDNKPTVFSVAMTCASPFKLTETSRVNAFDPVKKSHARSA
jgi:hypothetical protein